MMNKKLLPTKNFKSAAICTVVLLFLLWATDYPVDEWAVVALALYIALRLSSEIIAGLAAYAARRLAGYGKVVMQKYGVAVPEKKPTELRPYHVRLVKLAILTVAAFAYGAALTIGIIMAAALGLTPLSSYFLWIASGLLAVGATGLSLVFGVPAMVFVMADTRRKNFDTKITRIHAITEGLAQTQAWRVAS